MPVRVADAKRNAPPSIVAGGGASPSGRGEQLRRARAIAATETDRNVRLQSRRLANFEAQKLLRTFSSLDRVKKCRHVRAGQRAVEVRQRPDGRAYFGNLQTCGSVWACPHCADKILAVRAAELQTGIRAHWSQGGSCALLTLTMRHRPGQRLADLWDALTAAWRAASGGTSGTRRHWSSIEWVKRVEVTVGPNGWHVHIHALLFLDGDQVADLDPLSDATFRAWRLALIKSGMEAPEEGPGIDLKRLSLAGMRQEVAAYLAKGTYTGAVALNERQGVAERSDGVNDSRLVALEIASANKRARGSNRTPFQVLADFVRAGEASDAELWREWEASSFGRRAMTWSRGTRDRLLSDAELTDDQAAQEDDGAGVVIAVINPEVWPAIAASPVLAQRMLAVVELAGHTTEPHTLIAAIAEQAGFAGAVGPPPPVQESEG